MNRLRGLEVNVILHRPKRAFLSDPGAAPGECFSDRAHAARTSVTCRPFWTLCFRSCPAGTGNEASCKAPEHGETGMVYLSFFRMFIRLCALMYAGLHGKLSARRDRRVQSLTPLIRVRGGFVEQMEASVLQKC